MLKSCPFCGAKEDEIKALSLSALKQNGKDIWQVFCLSCKAAGPRSSEENVAIARWNSVTRTGESYEINSEETM